MFKENLIYSGRQVCGRNSLLRCLTYFSREKVSVFHFPTRIFFKNYLGWRGHIISLKKNGQVHNLKISDRLLSLTIQEFFSEKKSWPGLIARVVSFKSGRCINLSSGVSKKFHIDQSEYHFCIPSV